ncbi:unnamed protein product [Orchesella dallaii]|uniref:Glutamate-gated chloride channel n=1 Tax=Orchesella dallaii TaxID=48710 RepID=A0ABP1R1X1_9HEXA
MNLKTVIIFIFAAFAINETTSQKDVNPEGEILESLVPNFNKLSRVRPVSRENVSAPVLVSVKLYVRDIRIQELDNEYSVQLTFRQQWSDERLSYSSRDSSRPYVSLINSQNEIWQPDTFFGNEIDGGKYHDLMMRNQYIRISPDGTVLKSVRISLRLSCPMIYWYFPFDKQTCSLRFASYGFTKRDLVFVWRAADPVLTSFEINSHPFFLEDSSTDYCDAQTNTGTYSCLRVDFLFQRVPRSYIVTVYIPTMMTVITSWVSFWITPKAVTARTLVATLTLFVLAIQTAEANKTFPQISYTKAVDKWTGTCLTFVFAALLEFVAVHSLLNRKEKNNLISKLESLAHRFDVVSRIAFPVLFVLFNICYWMAYYF